MEIGKKIRIGIGILIVGFGIIVLINEVTITEDLEIKLTNERRMLDAMEKMNCAEMRIAYNIHRTPEKYEILKEKGCDLERQLLP